MFVRPASGYLQASSAAYGAAAPVATPAAFNFPPDNGFWAPVPYAPATHPGPPTPTMYLAAAPGHPAHQAALEAAATARLSEASAVAAALPMVLPATPLAVPHAATLAVALAALSAPAAAPESPMGGLVGSLAGEAPRPRLAPPPGVLSTSMLAPPPPAVGLQGLGAAATHAAPSGPQAALQALLPPAPPHSTAPFSELFETPPGLVATGPPGDATRQGPWVPAAATTAAVATPAASLARVPAGTAGAGAAAGATILHMFRERDADSAAGPANSAVTGSALAALAAKTAKEPPRAWGDEKRDDWPADAPADDEILEAKLHTDGCRYVKLEGQWIRATARYYCLHCKLFGNQLQPHLHSQRHATNKQDRVPPKWTKEQTQGHEWPAWEWQPRRAWSPQPWSGARPTAARRGQDQEQVQSQGQSAEPAPRGPSGAADGGAKATDAHGRTPAAGPASGGAGQGQTQGQAQGQAQAQAGVAQLVPVKPPAPWQLAWSQEHGAYYYWNPETEAVQWDQPETEPEVARAAG